jgi:hypothetical protein
MGSGEKYYRRTIMCGIKQMGCKLPERKSVRYIVDLQNMAIYNIFKSRGYYDKKEINNEKANKRTRRLG